MSFSGNELRERNEKIVKCITELKSQRNELNFLIEKQQEERTKLQTEMERISYKLSLINKSLSQRVKTKTNYDRTIRQAEEGYNNLVESSGLLLNTVAKDVEELEQSMDKKVGTENSVGSEHYSDNASVKKCQPDNASVKKYQPDDTSVNSSVKKYQPDSASVKKYQPDDTSVNASVKKYQQENTSVKKYQPDDTSLNASVKKYQQDNTSIKIYYPDNTSVKKYQQEDTNSEQQMFYNNNA